MKHYLATSTQYQGCVVIGSGYDADGRVRFIVKYGFRYTDYRTNIRDPLRLMNIIRRAVVEQKAKGAGI